MVRVGEHPPIAACWPDVAGPIRWGVNARRANSASACASKRAGDVWPGPLPQHNRERSDAAPRGRAASTPLKSARPGEGRKGQGKAPAFRGVLGEGWKENSQMHRTAERMQLPRTRATRALIQANTNAIGIKCRVAARCARGCQIHSPIASSSRSCMISGLVRRQVLRRDFIHGTRWYRRRRAAGGARL